MKTKFHIPHSLPRRPAGTFRSGFLLIEVIIALALFIATLTIFGVVLSTLPLTKTARNQNLAYHIAAKKIEELRNTPFVSLPSSGSFVDAGFASLESPSGQLTVADYGSNQIKRVTVLVSWQEGGLARSVTMETLMARPDSANCLIAGVISAIRVLFGPE